MPNSASIPTEIISSVDRTDQSPRQVEREFADLINSGAKIQASGTAKRDPMSLFKKGLKPKHKIELFGTRFYFTHVRQIPELRFFVCYVVPEATRSARRIYPRIIYKDLSLVWRSASHFTSVNDEIWVGKGEIKEFILDGDDVIGSDESTTDLPLEMQSAVESLLSWTKRRPASGAGLLPLILKQAPAERIEPYRDFTHPLRAAAAVPENLINSGNPVAWFSKPNDPTSLKFQKGYEPDFQDGVHEQSESYSKLYGGTLKRFRILSTNRKVQYYFFAGARHVWIAPPQAFTTQLSTYGVRTITVEADEDLFVPGYEYHHEEETENGTELYSQIPAGFVGETCPLDDAKADASPWLDKIPAIRSFRQIVLGKTR